MKSFKEYISEATAEEVYAELQKHEPFKKIQSDLDQKQFINKSIKTLKKYGVKDWMVQNAVKDYTKDNAGRTKVYINPLALVQYLIKSGDLKR